MRAFAELLAYLQAKGVLNMEDYQEITYESKSPKGKKSPVKKGILIFVIILIACLVLGVGCRATFNGLLGSSVNNDATIDYSSDYIGVLTIEGTISETESSSVLTGTSGYHHQWLLNRIDDMINDDQNQGLVLFINTPGGSVYASDELYYKIKEYKETGRPVYSAMGSQCTSGGYYISAPCDKIIANRNCWTGSIGVTIGTLYDISGLLDKLGVETVTITSGDNKAMGSTTDPMTSEQKAIFQSLVDEAYDQFVGIVAEGRDMKVAEVKKLADGRVYTAKQAKRNGLIDEIGTLEEAIETMQEDKNLWSSNVEYIDYQENTSFGSLFAQAFKNKEASKITEYDQLKALMAENNKFTVTYMATVQK